MADLKSIKPSEFREYIEKETGSESLCLAKWYNASIWLGSGMTTSCHHPLPHKVSVEEVLANPKALHNTATKKAERKQMQEGERPSGCDYCWRVEDMKDDSISDRYYKTKIYSNKELTDAYTLSPFSDVNLRTLEIAFDRTCNFACSYCNPAFSSTWVKDINEKGPYQNLTSDGRNHFTHPHDSSQLYGYKEQNPYVDAFFKWWESDLHKTLTELRITGGEPMMSPELWKLFDWFIENQDKSTTGLAVNSNLGAKDSLIDRLIETSHSIHKLDIYTSCEALGARAEYIRDGLIWDKWVDNVHKVVKNAKLNGFHMMCTINALCLPELDKFLDFCLGLKHEYGRSYPTFTLNILRFPGFQSLTVLPPEIKKSALHSLENWYDRNQTNELLHDMEKDHVNRLINYIKRIPDPHVSSPATATLLNDFKQFYNQYDIRRNKNFINTFPELASWYEKLWTKK